MSDDGALPQLDAKRQTELYTALIAALPLTSTHREELRRKRGFSDETIDRCRFRSGGEHVFEIMRAVQQEAQASDAEMEAAGLLAPSRKNGQLYANGQLAGDRVIIPYLAADGVTCYFLRPHKLGFKGHGVRVYCEYTACGWTTDDLLVLTEGEFKAAAAAQLGYRAIATPGISSFAGEHFSRLEQTLKQVPYKRLVVCFDRETKADPRLPSYKDDFRKRYDVEWYSWLLATKLDGLVVQLPTSWMENGKIDIDGALAAGRDRSAFDQVVATAVPPGQYLNELEEEAGAVVARRVRRYANADRPKPLKIFDSRTAGYGYVWEPPGEDLPPEPISDFVVKLERMVQTDTQMERIVRVVNKSGEASEPLVVQPTDMSGVRQWRQWAASHGDYNWFGKQYHLDAVWTHLHNQHDGSLIRRTALGGEIEPGLWLFQNGIITQGRYIPPRTTDGIAWVGRRGYEMSELEGQPGIRNVDPESARQLGAKHAELLELMRRNLGDATGWLGLGWAIATVFSLPIFNRYKSFPILFGMGEAGSGKTTMARWLMNGFFGIDTQGKPMMSTEKSQYRLLAKRCSLAAWFDEFRESRDTARHVTAFCSIYNRQGYSRAVRSNDLQTDNVPVRGALLLGGVVPPKDDQLLSRCVLLRHDADRRDNRSEEEGGTYGQVEQQLDRMNDFLVSALLRYDQLLPELMSELQVVQGIFYRHTGNARMALNYAMPVAAFHTLCGDLVESRRLIEFTLESMSAGVDRLLGDHPLTDFWDAISAMATKGVLTKDHLGADHETVWLWLPGIFQEYEANHRRRRDQLQFTQADVKDWITKQPYWRAPEGKTGNVSRRDVQKRLGGANRRCVALRRAYIPAALAEALESVGVPETPESPYVQGELLSDDQTGRVSD